MQVWFYYVARTASPTNTLRRILHRERTRGYFLILFLFFFAATVQHKHACVIIHSTLRINSSLCSFPSYYHTNFFSLILTHSDFTDLLHSLTHSINKFMSTSLRSYHSYTSLLAV